MIEEGHAEFGHQQSDQQRNRTHGCRFQHKLTKHLPFTGTHYFLHANFFASFAGTGNGQIDIVDTSNHQNQESDDEKDSNRAEVGGTGFHIHNRLIEAHVLHRFDGGNNGAVVLFFA